MSKLRVILAFFATRTFYGFLVVFTFTALLYGVAQTHPSFTDPDSFYHAGMAARMSEQGTVLEFPWLPFTTLADSFADHHYLYHLLLLPFVWLFGPLVGTKVAAATLGAFAVAMFYLAGRALRVRGELMLALSVLLATSMNFMFRMNLAKAASLSVALLMLAVIALARRKWWQLFIIGFLYIWAHGSWPLLGFIVLVFAGVELYNTRKLGEPLRMLLMTVLGLLAGLIINPYFPQNLEFYWYQTIHAAVINYVDVINVGMEWQGYDPALLIPQNGAPLIIITVCGAVALAAALWSEKIIRRKKVQTNWLAALAVIAAVFLVMAIRSQRHIEYFVPFGVLLAAVWFEYLRRQFNLRKLWLLSFGEGAWPIYGAAIFFGLVFPVLAIRDAYTISDRFHDPRHTFSWHQHRAATDWMKNHLPESAVIFHGSWADFPALFYHAPQFRYVAGLDPTFLYIKNPAMFVAWREASQGRVRDISEVVGFYESKYVYVVDGQENLEAAVAADRDFRLVYKDDEAKIYMLFP